MKTVNHFESADPVYRVAHDGEQVLSVTFASGRTTTRHQILSAPTWEEIEDKLLELELTIADELIPTTEPENV
jgi:hypothetical protein